MRENNKRNPFRQRSPRGAKASTLLGALFVVAFAATAQAQTSTPQQGLFVLPASFLDSLALVDPRTTRRPVSTTRLSFEWLNLYRKSGDPIALTGSFSGSAFVPVTSSDLLGNKQQTPGLKLKLEAEILDQPVEFSGFYTLPNANESLFTGLSTGTAGGATLRSTAIYTLDPGGDVSNYINSNAISQLYVNHSSQLFGAEANTKSAFGIPGLMVGIRGLYLGEDLSTVAQRFGSTTAIDAVTIQTRNYLLGPQIGFERMFDIGGGIKIGGTAKAGILANLVERERSFISRNQTQTRAQQNYIDGITFAQVFELNPRIEVPLAQGVTLTFGGTFLWLNNVSTAFPHFATVTDLQDVNLRAKDRVFHYGVQAGITIDLDTVAMFSPAPMGKRFLEGRIQEFNGPTPIPVTLYGEINKMVLAWDDGVQRTSRIVDNTSAPSIFGAKIAAELSRGWTTGVNIEAGLNTNRSVAVSQFLPGGEKSFDPDLRYLDWWIRSNRYGKFTVGHTSTATDGVVLTDTSGTNGAASANIGLIGGDLMLRAADALDPSNTSLVDRTSISDFFGGATIDTLRRDVMRYETPEWNGFDFLVAARSQFWDAAVRYRLDLASWQFRASLGYVRDTDAGDRAALGFTRDRREWKGGMSLLHTPTGLFVTTAFVNRQFRGNDSSNQAVFGENKVDEFGNVIPGTHRPDLNFAYLKTGMRRQFNAIGETKFFTELAIAKDGITDLREAGPKVVTSSQLNMLGAGIVQDIDAYNAQLYLGFRHYSFDVEGLRDSTTFGVIASPAPIKDINLVYSGVRIKF
ncbi:MAG: porin [Xanthobacteraceae bacterium]|nr:porin [Xanthobacteraceae bacterium]